MDFFHDLFEEEDFDNMICEELFLPPDDYLSDGKEMEESLLLRVDDAVPKYEFEQLKGGSLIRLLEISRTGPNSSPRFEITIADMEQTPSFEALSYVWGSPERPYKLPVQNGDKKQFVKLTKNLAEALHYMPRHMETKRIWIDQLCINQDDLDEKNKQVSLMGDIYRAAQKVLVWLGVGDPAVELDKFLNLQESLRIFNSSEGEGEDREKAVKEIAEVRRILRHPWFTRTWVVQESASGSKIELVVGSRIFSWKTLMFLAYPFFQEAEMTAFISHLGARSMWVRCFQNPGTTWGNNRTKHPPFLSGSRDPAHVLCRILTTFAPVQDATEPKDKLFAYLGLWKPRNFEIDYRMTLSEICIGLSRCIMQDTESLEFLEACKGMNELAGFEDLPSWTPDLISAGVRQRSPITGSLDGEIVTWQTSKKRKHQDMSQHLNDPCFTVRGKIVFYVEDVSSYVIGHMSRGDDWDPTRVEKILNLDEAETGFMKISLAEEIERLVLLAKNLESKINMTEPPETIRGGVRWESDDQTHDATETQSSAFFNRRFIRTTTGLHGVVPYTTKSGDAIAVLHGSCVPFLLRKVENSTEFNVVGHCYIEGIMFGEAVTWEEDEADEIILF